MEYATLVACLVAGDLTHVLAKHSFQGFLPRPSQDECQSRQDMRWSRVGVPLERVPMSVHRICQLAVA